MSVAAIVVAGGRGERFGGLKQFAELHGRTLASLSVERCREVADVVELGFGHLGGQIGNSARRVSRQFAPGWPHGAACAGAGARAMLAELGRLNARWTAEGRPTLDIGIGVNSGEMIAGNIGADTLMSYTVIGDAVNLASRLESLTKERGARIIISGATRDRLRDPADLRPLGAVTVKGRTQAVEIFAVGPDGGRQ
mgnify:CR=1 FL=1